MQTTETQGGRKRPDPTDPRIGTGREPEPKSDIDRDAAAYISDEEADGDEPGDGKELGG